MAVAVGVGLVAVVVSMNLHIFFLKALVSVQGYTMFNSVINTRRQPSLHTLLGSSISQGLLQILDDPFPSSSELFIVIFNHCLHCT